MSTVLATEFDIRSAIADIRMALDRSGPIQPNIWGFYSNKNRELLTVLGDVTFIQAVLLEGDKLIRSYYVSGGINGDEALGGGRELHILSADGSEKWYFCGRYENLIKSPSKTMRLRLIQRKEDAERVGAKFEIRTERDFADRMVEFRNWLTLCAAMTRARNFSSMHEASILNEKLSKGDRLQISHLLEVQDCDQALMIAAIARGIACGQVQCDLSKNQICFETIISSYLGSLPSNVDLATEIKIQSPAKGDCLPRNRRTARVPELWRDLKNWPAPNPELINDSEIYRRNKLAIEMYLNGRSFDEIFSQAKVKRDWTRALFRKCLEEDRDGAIRGFRALVKYSRSGGYERHAPVPQANNFDARTDGYSGVFVQLLQQFPDQLTQIIEAHVLKTRHALINKIPEARIRWKVLKSEIHNFLRKNGFDDDMYPFNTVDQAYSSIAALGRAVLHKKPMKFIMARSGKEAGRRTNIGKGIPSLIQATAPFQIVEMDFHMHDSAAIVEIETPSGSIIDAPVARWWVGAIVDTYNKAILGTSDSFEKQTTESCVLDLIDSALEPPKPLESLKDFTASQDGCWLPNQLIPSFGFHGWDVLKLDRAWAHSSTNVLSSLVTTVGCAVCFGRPREWWARSIVERTFLELTSRGAQRLPTTYGNGPKDTRRNKPEQTAIKLRVRQDEICDLARSNIRAINETGNEGAFWERPLGSLERAVLTKNYFPRPLPEERKHDRPTMWVTIKVRIEGNANRGISPSVRTARCRFRGVKLAQAWGLVGHFAYLQIKNRDIRIARVCNERTGEFIGSVSPDRRWLISQTSWRNFLMIQKFGKRQRDGDVPVDPTTEFLVKKTIELTDKSTKGEKIDSRTTATEIQRIQRDMQSSNPLEVTQINDQESNELPDKSKRSNKTLNELFGAPPAIPSFSRGLDEK
jgi:putative transposase